MTDEEQLDKPAFRISPDVVYQEMYQELRRFRDSELIMSNWYTTVLLTIAGAIFAARYVDPRSQISLLFDTFLIKAIISAVTLVIVLSAIYSIAYARSRYSQLRKYVDNNLEPPWKDFVPERKTLQPHHLVLANQIVLLILVLFVVWLPG